jgi:hypothetical protein
MKKDRHRKTTHTACPHFCVEAKTIDLIEEGVE